MALRTGVVGTNLSMNGLRVSVVKWNSFKFLSYDLSNDFQIIRLINNVYIQEYSTFSVQRIPRVLVFVSAMAACGERCVYPPTHR